MVVQKLFKGHFKSYETYPFFVMRIRNFTFSQLSSKPQSFTYAVTTSWNIDHAESFAQCNPTQKQYDMEILAILHSKMVNFQWHVAKCDAIWTWPLHLPWVSEWYSYYNSWKSYDMQHEENVRKSIFFNNWSYRTITVESLMFYKLHYAIYKLDGDDMKDRCWVRLTHWGLNIIKQTESPLIQAMACRLFDQKDTIIVQYTHSIIIPTVYELMSPSPIPRWQAMILTLKWRNEILSCIVLQRVLVMRYILHPSILSANP